MKNFIEFLFLCPLVSVMFWNAENFFDYFDGGFSSSDKEFSSRGPRHWTKARFGAKVDGIAKTVLWADAPLVVGLAEVENDFVLRRLCGGEVLRKLNYRYVHFESRDTRGIDCALLYRSDSLDFVYARPIPVVLQDSLSLRIDTLDTRDILYVCLRERSGGGLWHFLVNHHPSKYGGSASGPRRIAAMRALVSFTDSLAGAGEKNIVAMGDFNDTPLSPSFALADGHLVNLGSSMLEDSPSAGTIRFHGKWELIDNFLVSPELAGNYCMSVLHPPFLMERDRAYPGEKPYRTYIGPRYNAGLSDHLPVCINRKNSIEY